jgi:hypothetical protein
MAAVQVSDAGQLLLKLSVMHWRHEGVDSDTFVKWFLEEQVPRQVKLIQKHDITHYKVYATPGSVRQTFQGELDAIKAQLPGWKMDTHDLVVSYYFYSADSMKALLADPEWNEKALPFEEGWVDSSRAEIQVGWEYVYLKDKKIVNTVSKDYD